MAADVAKCAYVLPRGDVRTHYVVDIGDCVCARV